MKISVSDYYHTLESRLGYKLVLGGTRHFGYYEKGAWIPFPIGAALRRMEECLYETLNLKSNSWVLDGGTGNGDVAIYMAKRGLTVKAIDLLDLHVGFARSNVKRKQVEDRVEVSQGSFEELKFVDNTFDGAYTMETIMHADDPDKAIRQFHRVLKSGAVVAHVEYEHDMDHNPSGRTALAQINGYATCPPSSNFL